MQSKSLSAYLQQTSHLCGDFQLDVRGERCPYTFIRTKLRMETLTPGQRLTVLVDSDDARHNVPRSVQDWGHEFLGEKQYVKYWALTFRKSEG